MRIASIAATSSAPALPRSPRGAMPGFLRRAAAASPFTFQASWINDAEFAGYFVAIDKGYYKAEGLDLTYLSGGPDVIPESALIAGKADLTLTTPDTTIQAIVDQGAPFKIIGAQYQKNPIGIVIARQEPDQDAGRPGRQDPRRAAGQRHLGRGDAEDSTASTRARSTSCPTRTIRRR